MKLQVMDTSEYLTNNKFRFMVYGKSGIGKTLLISTIKGRVLVLNTDKGLATLRKVPCKYVSANTWPEVLEFLTFIKTKECRDAYDWIVFDSVTALSDILFHYLLEDKKLSGFDFWRDYGNFMMKFMRFLRDQNIYHTLSIFEAIDKDNAQGFTEQIFGVQGQVGSKIPNYYDEVFALKMIIHNKEQKRMLQTLTTLGWTAKDRSQSLDSLEEPDLNNIMEKISKGGKK